MNKKKLIIDIILHIILYSFVLFLASLIFKKTIQVSTNNYGFWLFLTSTLLYILNKTIKPILIWLTIPITGLTLGLFYPFINVFILNIADVIMFNHFNINGILMSFVVAVFISISNFILGEFLFSSLKRGNKR